MPPRPVPEPPGQPDPACPGGSDPPGGHGADSTAGPVSVAGLLLLLALAAVPTVPGGSLIAVAVLLLVAVAVLGEAAPSRAGRSFSTPTGAAAGPRDPEDDLADHIGDAGAYYYDRHGRPTPIDDAF